MQHQRSDHELTSKSRPNTQAVNRHVFQEVQRWHVKQVYDFDAADSPCWQQEPQSHEASSESHMQDYSPPGCFGPLAGPIHAEPGQESPGVETQPKETVSIEATPHGCVDPGTPPSGGQTKGVSEAMNLGDTLDGLNGKPTCRRWSDAWWKHHKGGLHSQWVAAAPLAHDSVGHRPRRNQKGAHGFQRSANATQQCIEALQEVLYTEWQKRSTSGRCCFLTGIIHECPGCTASEGEMSREPFLEMQQIMQLFAQGPATFTGSRALLVAYREYITKYALDCPAFGGAESNCQTICNWMEHSPFNATIGLYSQNTLRHYNRYLARKGETGSNRNHLVPSGMEPKEDNEPEHQKVRRRSSSITHSDEADKWCLVE